MVRIFNQYVAPATILLAGFEFLLIAASMFAGVGLRCWNDPDLLDYYAAYFNLPVQALTLAVLIQTCFYCNDLYDRVRLRSRLEEALCVAESLGAACVLVAFAYFLVPELLIGRSVILFAMLFAALASLTLRVGIDRVWPAAAAPQTVLILGSGALAGSVGRELLRRADLNLRVAGYASPTGEPAQLAGGNVLGPLRELTRIVADHSISRIIVALEDGRGRLPIRDLVRLRVSGLQVDDAQTALAGLTGHVWLSALRPSWFAFSDGFRRSRATLLTKRVMDLGLGLLGLVASLPVSAVVAVAVKLDSRGPILYRQTRVGMRGRHFEVLKFRSMHIHAEADGPRWATDGDPRVTRVGRVIRKFRLDELPQFVNVIRGDMSFVGPRPERPEFVEVLRGEIPFYDERHSVRPGLTGWAQVRYQYGSSAEDAYRKLEYDLFYLKNLSIAFDLAIVFETVRTVLLGRGGK